MIVAIALKIGVLRRVGRLRINRTPQISTRGKLQTSLIVATRLTTVDLGGKSRKPEDHQTVPRAKYIMATDFRCVFQCRVEATYTGDHSRWLWWQCWTTCQGWMFDQNMQRARVHNVHMSTDVFSVLVILALQCVRFGRCTWCNISGVANCQYPLSMAQPSLFSDETISLKTHIYSIN